MATVEPGTGSGPEFETPNGLAVDAQGKLLFTDLSLLAVVGVDPTTGDRAIISDAGTGSGPDFQAPINIAVEADGQLVVVDSGLQAVLRVAATAQSSLMPAQAAGQTSIHPSKLPWRPTAIWW